MTITLQISLPDALVLTADELAQLTKRKPLRLQMEWLKSHGWPFTLDLDKGLLVGRLYAHLRLAGLQPEDVVANTGPAALASAGGFNRAAVR
jgi:hypothetical protein